MSAQAASAFADDTKLFTRSDDEAATTVMQEDRNRLQQWSNDWLLRFHPQKCSVLKLGSKKSGTNDVEDVQRLASIRDKPYPERLATLKLPSLEFRRKRGDMIDLWKYIHGVYDTDRPHFDIGNSRDTRGNSLKIYKHRCRLNLRSNSFSHRVINDWNGLPESVVTAPTVNCFKNRLDKCWENHPSLYNPQCAS
ncbi:hypothetical protein EGW08_011842 [Elysia chlorotica]|uniref:Reverse transcriptase domain-containing protein n=1 Tax=Elysia chlorotica TaxID=188477 RepID=A0A3S1HJ05_ELYCH|nr:hypothetical protein EGW08_011842 [Elysia chlorotica]